MAPALSARSTAQLMCGRARPASSGAALAAARAAKAPPAPSGSAQQANPPVPQSLRSPPRVFYTAFDVFNSNCAHARTHGWVRGGARAVAGPRPRADRRYHACHAARNLMPRACAACSRDTSATPFDETLLSQNSHQKQNSISLFFHLSLLVPTPSTPPQNWHMAPQIHQNPPERPNHRVLRPFHWAFRVSTHIAVSSASRIARPVLAHIWCKSLAPQALREHWGPS